MQSVCVMGGAVRCGAVRCGAARCGAVRSGAVRSGAARRGAARVVRTWACGRVGVWAWARRVRTPTGSRNQAGTKMYGIGRVIRKASDRRKYGLRLGRQRAWQWAASPPIL